MMDNQDALLLKTLHVLLFFQNVFARFFANKKLLVTCTALKLCGITDNVMTKYFL